MHLESKLRFVYEYIVSTVFPEYVIGVLQTGEKHVVNTATEITASLYDINSELKKDGLKYDMRILTQKRFSQQALFLLRIHDDLLSSTESYIAVKDLKTILDWMTSSHELTAIERRNYEGVIERITSRNKHLEQG